MIRLCRRSARGRRRLGGCDGHGCRFWLGSLTATEQPLAGVGDARRHGEQQQQVSWNGRPHHGFRGRLSGSGCRCRSAGAADRTGAQGHGSKATQYDGSVGSTSETHARIPPSRLVTSAIPAEAATTADATPLGHTHWMPTHHAVPRSAFALSGLVYRGVESNRMVRGVNPLGVLGLSIFPVDKY